MVFTCNIGCDGAINKEDIVDIHRLTYHKTSCGKGGSLLQFGVLRFLYYKQIITHITKNTMAIGLPCYCYPITHLQVGSLYAFARVHGALDASL